jgi:hypothetical protein
VLTKVCLSGRCNPKNLEHGDTHTLLAKIDIQHAYRNIPVHEENILLMVMQWRVWTFGSRSAPKIFSAVADALEYKWE